MDSGDLKEAASCTLQVCGCALEYTYFCLVPVIFWRSQNTVLFEGRKKHIHETSLQSYLVWVWVAQALKYVSR